MSGEFGPVHRCKDCGRDVQVYTGPRTAYPRLVESDECGNMAVHRHAEAVFLDRWMECLCGVDVVEIESGERLNQDGTPHVCQAPREEPGVEEQGDTPRGVLGWRQSASGRARP